jgi:multiple sugar transport system substrate-binding protein
VSPELTTSDTVLKRHLLDRRRLLKASAATAGLAAAGLPRRTSAQSPVNLRVAVYQEPARVDVQKNFIAAIVEAHPDIKVSVESADFSTYYTKLNTNLAAGRAPDVFMMSGAYFYAGAMRNAFKDLGPYLQQAKIDLSKYFTEDANSVYQGTTYAVPEELDIMALAYNKDLFDEAGVTYPTEKWTWDDLLDAATKLTRTTSDGKQTYGIYAVNNIQEMWGDLVKENGGSFLTADMKQAAINTPESQEAIQFAVDLIHKYKVSPTAQGVSSLPGYIESGGSPFMTGLVAMKFQGNYELGVLLESDAFKWDVVTMPQKKIKGGLAWAQAWVMYDKTPQPDAAWQFIEFMLSDKGNQVISDTPNKGQCPPLKSAAYDGAYGAPPPDNMKAFLDGYEYRQSFEFHPAWLEWGTAYGKALDPVFAGDVSVADGTNAAAQEVNAILARYKDFQP